MSEVAKEILQVNLEDEMRQSYLDYAMSVIVGRALPDVRDGLKPVHRRVLYAMRELGNDWNKPTRSRRASSATSSASTTRTATRRSTTPSCAWPSRSRCATCSSTGRATSARSTATRPAAMRYTEVRMAKLAHELLADIDKETVDLVPNYDESEHEPSVLPTRVPNLLINGSAGIAVGMATNIPPHNLREVIDACIALIDDARS
jgi:DNA gyrase subunit A